MMTRVLGMRAEPRQFNWAVVEGTQEAPILTGHETATAPVNLDEAGALSWVRQRAQFIISSNKPTAAVLRAPEFSPKGGNTDSARRRLRLEGVLLEVCRASSLATTLGVLATISKNLGGQSAKAYLEAGDVRGINIAKLPPSSPQPRNDPLPGGCSPVSRGPVASAGRRQPTAGTRRTS